MGKIKVVEIIADSELGGGPAHVLGLLKLLDQKKFEPFLICPDGWLSDKASQIKGVVIYHIPFKSKFDIVSFFELQSYLSKIKSFRDPFGPMVIHSHGARAGMFASMVSPRSAFKLYTEHLYYEDYHLSSRINEGIQKFFLARATRKSNLIIAVSTPVRNFLIKEKIVSKDQVVVIPNAIELETKDEGRRTKAIKTANRAPVIGTIGSLNPQKGQVYLIEAMKKIIEKFPLATLEIIGEGEERERLKSEVERLRLERHITLLGRKANVEKYLKHWDVFVLPSIAETFGISILEAMRSSVPVVATRVGGIVDIIENKKNGLLVPKEDADALGKSIIEIIDHPVLAAKLKRGGIERIKDFDWKKIIREIEEIYSAPFNLEKMV